MHLIDTYEGILMLRKQVLADPKHLFAHWDEYIERSGIGLRDLLIDDSRGYDFELDVQPVLMHCLTEDFAKLQMAHESMLTIGQNLEASFQSAFETPARFELYFLCGLCNEAVWSTTMRGARVLILCAEKIVEEELQSLTRLSPIVNRAVGYLGHAMLRSESAVFYYHEADKAVWRLFSEGISLCAQQKMLVNPEYYIQNRHGWLDWCKENLPLLAREYLSRIEENDSVQDFFDARRAYMGRTETGYYLAASFVQDLMQNASLKQVCGYTFTEAKACLIRYLKKTSK